MPTWLIVISYLSIALGIITAIIIAADVIAYPQLAVGEMGLEERNVRGSSGAPGSERYAVRTIRRTVARSARPAGTSS